MASGWHSAQNYIIIVTATLENGCGNAENLHRLCYYAIMLPVVGSSLTHSSNHYWSSQQTSVLGSCMSDFNA